MGENHKQAGFFADTEIRFIDKTDSPDTNRREHFGIDTVKTGYLQRLNNIDPYH